MRRWPLAMIMLLALLSGGCLVTEEQLRLQREVLELTRRLDGVERGLRTVQEETSGDIKGRVEELTRGQAQQQAGLDGLRVDLQGVQGRFDDLGRADATQRQDLTLLKDELGLQVADLAKRLAKVEQAQATAAAVAAAAPPPAVESADQLYERALQTIRDKQEPATGRDLMETFLKRYPADQRAVNAAYWIGETHYSEQAFDKAVLQFEEVAQKYGDDPKVAAALYKQALAFEALKDRKSARLVMSRVVERFPLSEEAKMARDKLKEWKP